VSEGELERLQRAVRRLLDGQREALEVLRQALEDDTPTEEALGDLEDILEGSLEDARPAGDGRGGQSVTSLLVVLHICVSPYFATGSI